jgi:hypothetical protein
MSHSEAIQEIINRFGTNEKKEEFQEKIILGKSQICLWHKNKKQGHVGNFDNQCACCDCMKEIKNGRCTVDIEQFDLDTTFYFRNFWNKVDIRSPDECWPWLGGIREHKHETVAYVISPFHSAKSQSAPRVAFWFSRGYTGKRRITHQKGCHYTCCNPLHLRIKGVELENPTEIEKINLQLKNIYEHVRSYSEDK